MTHTKTHTHTNTLRRSRYDDITIRTRLTRTLMHELHLCSARAPVQLSVAHCSSSHTEHRLCGTLRAVKPLMDHQGARTANQRESSPSRCLGICTVPVQRGERYGNQMKKKKQTLKKKHAKATSTPVAMAPWWLKSLSLCQPVPPGAPPTSIEKPSTFCSAPFALPWRSKAQRLLEHVYRLQLLGAQHPGRKL